MMVGTDNYYSAIDSHSEPYYHEGLLHPLQLITISLPSSKSSQELNRLICSVAEKQESTVIARPPKKKKKTTDQLPMCGQVGGWGRSQDRRVRSVHPVTRRKKTVRSNLICLLLANENWCFVPL